MNSSSRIIITAGDPSGIGIEIIFKYFKYLKQYPLPKRVIFTIVGSKTAFLYYANLFNTKIKFTPSYSHQKSNQLKYNLEFFGQTTVDFIDVNLPWNDPSNLHPSILIGTTNLASGRIAYTSLKTSVTLANSFKKNVGIVTAPLSKKAISLSMPNFIDHTDFFTRSFKRQGKTTMVFLSKLLNVLLLTTHIPIDEVKKHINKKNIFRILDHAIELQQNQKPLSKTTSPIYVLGINPHAGENGLIGKEDEKLKKYISLYLKQPLRQNIKIIGPISADTAFQTILKTNDKRHIVISCYHDQALIPFKTLTYLKKLHSTQTTWGLPIVRTSVDHGTAFDIAGKNIANYTPLKTAITKNLELQKNN